MAKVYDIELDQMVEVTQEWVDASISKLKELHDALKVQGAGTADGSGRARQEVRQEGGSAAEGGQGIQSGGQAREAREVAVAWAAVCDGFIQVPRRAIANPDSSHLVWMAAATWEKLASHATERGLFYIPCETVASPEELRLLVNQEEIADAS